jgi:hypothetical protein
VGSLLVGKPLRECIRAQLEVVSPHELAEIFSLRRAR